MLRKLVVVLLTGVMCLIGVTTAFGAEKVKITFATWGTPQLEGPSITAQLEAFAKAYPEIEVKWDMIPFWDFEPKVKTKMAAGIPYDVFWIATEFGPRSFLQKGAVRNLQPYVDKELEKDANFFITKYLPGITTNVSQDGDIYFLPFLGDNSILYFNKNRFDEAGVAYPPQTWEGIGEAQWNWDAFVQVAQKLTKRKGEQVDVWGYADSGSVINLETLVHQLGGDPELIPQSSEEVFIDTPTARAALQFLYDIRYKYKVAPGIKDLPGDELWQRFLAGRVAMCTLWSAHTLAFIDASFEWDVAQLPMNKKKGGSTWHSYMAIAENSKRPNEAWELLKLLCGPQGQVIASGFGFEAPLMEIAEVYEAYDNAKPIVSRSTIIESSKYSHLRWPITGAMEIFRLFNQDQLPKLFLGQQTIEQTVENLKEKTAEIIQKYK